MGWQILLVKIFLGVVGVLCFASLVVQPYDGAALIAGTVAIGLLGVVRAIEAANAHVSNLAIAAVRDLTARR